MPNIIPSAKLAGYTFVPRKFATLKLAPYYIAIEEEKPTMTLGGILLPTVPSVTTGTVVAVGALAEEQGICVGDRVAYEKWMGGRWEFDMDNLETQRCLIMDVEHVIMKVED